MNRLLVLALDGAEWSLIEKWADEGLLPNIKSLFQQGKYGRITSDADLLAGSVWFSFYTGLRVANHGLYNYLVWRADKMTTEPPSPKWLSIQPFWRSFGGDGPRVVVVDTPLAYAPDTVNGIEVTGWSAHDTLGPLSIYPPDFGRKFRKRFGRSPHSEEKYGPVTKREFIELREGLIKLSRLLQDACTSLISEQNWDLFMVTFSPIHRGGHKLWNLDNITDSLTPQEEGKLGDALLRLYVVIDEAVGNLIRRAGPDTTVLLFSPKGMDDNFCRNAILPDMLHRVLADDRNASMAPRPGLLMTLREHVPLNLRHIVKSALPIRLRHQLTAFWRVGQINWSRTQAFSMMADVQGWIRINLSGRETAGIVKPGAEYDALCTRISEGLKTFVDADTGEPIIRKIVRSDRVFQGDRSDWLPDLIVDWVESPASRMKAAYSPLFGRIPWPTPGRNPEGRGGNHNTQGFLIAAGPGVKSGNIGTVDILDLAPTILNMLGQPVPAEMEGKPIRFDV